MSYSLSKLKIIYKPPITIIPRIISKGFILRLKKRGSINDVKKAPVLIVTKATETLEIFMALKMAIRKSAKSFGCFIIYIMIISTTDI